MRHTAPLPAPYALSSPSTISVRPSMSLPLRVLLLLLLLPLSLNSLSGSLPASSLPAPTQANVEKYKAICRKHINKEIHGMYREAGGSLPYPFLAPGSSQYLDMLWDWDSWLSDIALRQIILNCGTPKDSVQALQYERGCVLNALHYGGMDGWIPIWIERNAPSRSEMLAHRNPWRSNMHKPTLAQHAAFIVRTMNGDAEWLREPFYYLQAFVSKYMNHHRHPATGLLYWETDEAIGVDNDPSTFYRPDESSGSIFLNALMYKELLAMAYLSRCLSLSETAMQYDREAESLARAIRTHCWDPRDRFYYSVDLNLRPVEKPRVDGVSPSDLFLHVGQPRQYDCLIQRFSLWSGFMAPVGRHSHTTAGTGDCRAAVSGYHPLLLSSRCALPLPSREDVQHEGERQPLVVAGAGMDMCQLSRLPWAPQVRIHRRGTPPGMEDNHTPRQGF